MSLAKRADKFAKELLETLDKRDATVRCAGGFGDRYLAWGSIVNTAEPKELVEALVRLLSDKFDSTGISNMLTP